MATGLAEIARAARLADASPDALDAQTRQGRAVACALRDAARASLADALACLAGSVAPSLADALDAQDCDALPRDRSRREGSGRGRALDVESAGTARVDNASAVRRPDRRLSWAPRLRARAGDWTVITECEHGHADALAAPVAPCRACDDSHAPAVRVLSGGAWVCQPLRPVCDVCALAHVLAVGAARRVRVASLPMRRLRKSRTRATAALKSGAPFLDASGAALDARATLAEVCDALASLEAARDDALTLVTPPDRTLGVNHATASAFAIATAEQTLSGRGQS